MWIKSIKCSLSPQATVQVGLKAGVLAPSVFLNRFTPRFMLNSPTPLPQVMSPYLSLVLL